MNTYWTQNLDKLEAYCYRVISNQQKEKEQYLKKESEKFQKVELFQLWVNLPQKVKTLYPKVTRLTNDSIPVYESDNGCYIKVIAGTLEIDDNNLINGPGNEETSSPVAIMHVKVQPNQKLSLSIPSDANTAVYVRRGSMLLNKNNFLSKSASTVTEMSEFEECASCSLIQFSSKSRNQQTTGLLNLLAGTNGLDALLLVGEPLNEQVVWQGPLVQASAESWQESANAFNSIGKYLLISFCAVTSYNFSCCIRCKCLLGPSNIR